MARHKQKKKKVQAATRDKEEGRKIMFIVAGIAILSLILLYLGFQGAA